MWGTHHGNAAISGCLSRNQLSQRSPARPFLDRSNVRFQGASCPGLSPSPHLPALSCMRLKVPLSRTTLFNLIQSRPSTAPAIPLQHHHILPPHINVTATTWPSALYLFATKKVRVSGWTCCCRIPSTISRQRTPPRFAKACARSRASSRTSASATARPSQQAGTGIDDISPPRP